MMACVIFTCYKSYMGVFMSICQRALWTFVIGRAFPAYANYLTGSIINLPNGMLWVWC